jgi:hypothetical protein
MRDEVELNLRIARPTAESRFPAVLEYKPSGRPATALPDHRDDFPHLHKSWPERVPQNWS